MRAIATRVPLDLYERVEEYAWSNYAQPGDTKPPISRALRGLLEDVLGVESKGKSSAWKRGYADGFMAGKHEAIAALRSLGEEE